ncbi:RNA pseudouridine synthase 2, chloroplastic isoform X1 [Cynara cardunculus var. scolymus]|uniref:RNA pseudouridine synthase 2, chloroplastic isoform X1 n=2 Tax=Cynara cardunculus var. scolymus TaxID=59895 RepID=UPI000D625229|nr:RNA pseudouridine synthase 2, chloroplastic isoform X1 [Cynara cardunculus var. scolymus]XP_024969937.1 RNA pseudouridine synthase 2, chloroplastic isoform X1 [Cynara cardunculus var. scolymus]
MLSSIPTARTLTNSFASFFHRNPPILTPIHQRVSVTFCSGALDFDDEPQGEEDVFSGGRRRTNYTGVRLEESVEELKSGKIRLDTWISTRINGISRARVQSSIRSGLVSVNNRVTVKASHMVRHGDKVECTISELQPLKAEGEDIALDIVYEDEHVLVVNKPAHMVVHPAPGNTTGTLVNGILHHCSLPTPSFQDQELLSDSDDLDDIELDEPFINQTDSKDFSFGTNETSVRPGIVHRLDKGTSGLLVVAKDEHSHAHLSQQFKQHTIQRIYVSLTCGVPSPASGRVDIPIGRDLTNRIRMVADTGPTKCGKSRYAASRYRVVEILAGGGSALVEWKLETGRTHQIRAHAKYLGIPLMGDEVYGGTKNMALARLHPKNPSSLHGQLSQIVSKLDRPCLHALTLGFTHPCTGEKMQFSCLPPVDFAELLTGLRNIST